MKLEIEVISEEIIKPSSPTPDHLRHYKLSFLDQISPPVYNPLLLFYPTDGRVKSNNAQKYDQLKQSLSQVLTYYYPLAGRIKDNNLVDCNDEGVPFLQAQAIACRLSDAVNNPMPTEFRKLLPFELDEPQEFAFGIQLNIFDCGGICIAFCLSHKIADALSTLVFLKTWAAITRGETDDIVCPEFISATLFPPKNLSGFNPAIGITKENVVTKRFVFRLSSIESLIEKYSTSTTSIENQQQKSPSRIEALSVFIWSRFMAATKVESEPGRVYLMLHAVNLRTRMNPQLPEHSFGNYYRVAITIPSSDTEEESYNLVRRMRDSISKIDKDYVKKLQDGNEHLHFIKERAESFTRGEMATLNFTSLCRFPLYEADFGWSKPIWAGAPSLTFKNLVVFMDTVSGDGIEALIHLKEEDMAKFQEDQELLQFATG
ncbi:Salutaridinol 7-O-acetyltransferase, putative [Ricinus communis]|uniref:Salutaridinol 7-O-acetyltransferase, putative n=1 Tax=Ricinus communis TaxID=3988 RepID=B9RML2_RICCO|nr:Salutaridinol 7-O-acetyltransferase, putative [Ricinus communis]|eukprot:XP_002514981.1 vinorine synthase [Ricinus communis]